MKIRCNVRGVGAAAGSLIVLLALVVSSASGSVGEGVGPLFHLDTTEPLCWPNRVSYTDVSGIARLQPGNVAAQTIGVGVWSETPRADPVCADGNGCLHVNSGQQFAFSGLGCEQKSLTYTLGAAFGSCRHQHDLPIRLGCPLPGQGLVQTVVDDYPTLGSDDLLVPNWGGFGDLDGLLSAYAPVLRLSAEEQYKPVDIDVSLSGASLKAPGVAPSFHLTTIGRPEISQYSWKDFYIDLPCDDPTSCLQSYGDALGSVSDPYVVYATAIRDWFREGVPSDDDIVVLQYWFHYYYNELRTQECSRSRSSNGNHEGDWEHITVALTRGLEPRGVGYARHDEPPETVPWIWAEHVAGTHPVVYVAEGSHASYPHRGQNRSWSRWPFAYGWDCHQGFGDVVAPEGVPGNETYRLDRLPRWSNLQEPGLDGAWIKFSGIWGEDGGGFTPSPRGPAFHDSWWNAGGDVANLAFVAACPVDLRIHAPDGATCGPDTCAIPGSTYTVQQDDSLGVRRVQAFIPMPGAGEYVVEVLPLVGAPPESTYSLWSYRNRLGAPPDTVTLAEDVPIAEIPAGGYQVIPDIPFVGHSEVTPEIWDLEWQLADTASVVWLLTSPGGEFDVHNLLPQSLRLNGAVAPLSSEVVDEVTLLIRFPRGTAVHSVADAQPNTVRRVVVTGLFADSVVHVEAEADVELVGGETSTAASAENGRPPFTVKTWMSGRAGTPVQIELVLPHAGDLIVEVYDVGGRRTRGITSGRSEAGVRRLEWDGRSELGAMSASGVYFVRASLSGEQAVTRIVIAR